MKRRRKPPTGKGVMSVEVSTAGLAAQSEKMQLVAIAVRDLVFLERPCDGPVSVDELRRSGVLDEHELEVGATVGFPTAETVELRLNIRLVPKGELKPFEVKLGISGLFRKAPDQRNRDAVAILGLIGGPLLFPFAREVIMNTLARTIFGPIGIQPLRLGALFSDGDLAKIQD